MEFDLPKENSSIIKVIGVGGGGSNAVNHMYNQGIVGVDFIVCNTDKQALDISPVPFKLQLGVSLTEGRGAGSIPETGKNAAIESIEEIKDFLSKGTKMVFVTAGMGGGTGTGAAPVVAQCARELGILTVGIVTVPFNFEGRKRRQQAEDGLDAMRENVDTLLIINNDRLREMSGNLTIGNAFSQADDVLSTAARGIAEVISVTGSINVDFNDVNTVMRNSGVAIMGSATAEGENRAIKAVEKALNSPLLNDNDISGAKHILLNVTYGTEEVLMDEITDITDYVQNEAGSTADVIWGYGQDESLGAKLSVTLIATGFQSSPITGFEKAPEKKLVTLTDENKTEITTPLSKAVQANKPVEKIVNHLDEQPFLKSQDLTPTNEITQPMNKATDKTDQQQITFEFDGSSKSSLSPESEVKKYMLEDEKEADISIENVDNRNALSPEQQQKKNQERLSRIQEYTAKLRKADGIAQFENEPAYIRRKIELNNTKHSEEENMSRYGLSEGEDGISLKGNNSFLHDNVD